VELTTATLGAHSVFKTRLQAAFVAILNNHHPPKARRRTWRRPLCDVQSNCPLTHTYPSTRAHQPTHTQGVKPSPPEEKPRLITTYCDRLLRVGGAAEEQRVSEVLALVVYLKVSQFFSQSVGRSATDERDVRWDRQLLT